MTKTLSKTTNCPVSLTESAYGQLLKIRDESENKDLSFLRIGVKGGGCSGFSYVLGFDLKKEADSAYPFKDITILMDPGHGMYLAGMEIDYLDDLNNRGFIFNNPNADSTCGCGTSFST